MRYNGLKCIFSFKIINISAPTILQDPLMTLYVICFDLIFNILTGLRAGAGSKKCFGQRLPLGPGRRGSDRIARNLANIAFLIQMQMVCTQNIISEYY